MAASIPHSHYSIDYPSQFCTTNLPMEEEELSSMIFNNTSSMLPYLNYDINSPVSFGTSSDFMVIPQMSEIETGFRDFSVCELNNQGQVLESGEDCSGHVPSLWPPHTHSSLPQNWGVIQGQTAVKGDESEEVKVRKYSNEERKDRILRYLKKRNQRNFNKTIKYACRKTLADKRVRVRGRFAKNNEASQEEVLINHHQHNNFFQHEMMMMKYDEECWLQAAMENLGHFPFLGS